MNILPITTARVSTIQRAGLATASINSAEAQLNTIAQELSSGLAVTQASDNPAAAVRIQTLTQQVSDDTQYATNITAAQDQLNSTDGTLSSLSTLLTQASSTAAANVSTTTSSTEREAAAETIDTIYAQVASTATLKYGGRYVFGTDDAAMAPYRSTPDGLEFTGSTATLASQTAANQTLSFQVDGQSVFGGLSASISAGTALAPALEGTNRIVDLAGARNNGVTLGTINVSNGTATQAVDLSGADTVQDVVDAINTAAVPGVTASVGPTGLTLAATGGANITVTDPAGGSAAADLGIAHATASGANVAVTGTSPLARVTPETKLADLRGGAGIDLTGFTVSNGTRSTPIPLTGLTTVQQLVNAVNVSGTNVRASIRADGTGIDLSNATQGVGVTVTEAGGTTAAELGFTSFKATTTLASLNNGLGVHTPVGTQFTINTADGSAVAVGLSGITAVSTVQDAVNQINTAAAGKVTASLSPAGTGIVLTDNTTGTATLSVTAVAAATTARDLGLTSGAVTGNTLTGANVNPVTTPGLLTDLNDLRVALRKDDSDGIGRATATLQSDSEKVATAQAVVGARVQELNSRQATLATQSTTTQSLLSGVQDVDYATTVTQYQLLQTSLQASLQTTAKTMSLSLMDYLS